MAAAGSVFGGLAKDIGGTGEMNADSKTLNDTAKISPLNSAAGAVQDRTKLHIAQVVLRLDVGGLERLVLHLAAFARNKGHLVSVICLERPGTLAPEFEAAGLKIYCLNKPPGISPDVTRNALALLRELRPDVIHTHQIGALLYVGSAARRAGISAVVHTEHSDHVSNARTFQRRWRTKIVWWWAARYARKFICVSDTVANSARSMVPARKLQVIDNGIDLIPFESGNQRNAIRAEWGIPSDAPVIGTVARLAEVKRQDLLIRAFAGVRQANPNSHLILVGDGEARPGLERLVSSLGLKQCVHFTGSRPNPHAYLQAMDVFALTSRLEGLPLAVLEACAARLPVVATRVGGVPRVIEHNESGILIESGDQTALEDALKLLLADRALAKKLGEAGRQRIEQRYTIARMADDYERQYRVAIGDPPATSQ
jgi:sugar transferase (PEP-CTERM/EpsH1 system associated)